MEEKKPIIKREQIMSTKKPLSKKFAETFLSEDIKDVKRWLLMDVLIPEAKKTFLNTLSMLFNGETYDNSYSRSSERYYNDRNRINYRSHYRGSSSDSRSRREDKYNSDDSVDFRNIVLRQRRDAEDIINAMRDRIRNNNSVSVAELLDMIDCPGRYTDNNWGWDDERDIGIRKVASGGYLIDVAEPKYLK